MGEVLNVRKICKRTAEREVLHMRKFMKDLCWKWDNFVADVMKKRKLFKRCTACGKIIKDILIERKLSNRCAESEKIFKRFFAWGKIIRDSDWMWQKCECESFIECQNILQEM